MNKMKRPDKTYQTYSKKDLIEYIDYLEDIIDNGTIEDMKSVCFKKKCTQRQKDNTCAKGEMECMFRITDS